MAGYVVAVAGATGAVGRTMLRVLEERNFPVRELRALASERSAGKTLPFAGGKVAVQQLSHDSFEGVDIALFSAGAARSKEFAPSAVKAGAVVVDNSSAFRMDEGVPLVVPEVNREALREHKGIVANPNCSTIQMVVVLKPLHDAARVKHVFVATYQAVSGAGQKAVDELLGETRAVLEGRDFERTVFPHRIAFNCIPQIPQSDAFLENGYTSEEMKMVNETRKIMGDDSIRVSPTTVRVPVVTSHAEVVTVELERRLTTSQARELLQSAPGIVVLDDPASELYPLQTGCEGRDEVFVGRIREDIGCENGLAMWIVSDNLRKGAATNAVQIAECLIEDGLL